MIRSIGKGQTGDIWLVLYQATGVCVSQKSKADLAETAFAAHLGWFFTQRSGERFMIFCKQKISVSVLWNMSKGKI